MASLAGYLSMSVPAIAGGLLWGVHSILQVSQYVGGMTQSAAGVGAGEAVTGNIGFGNTNFGNHNAFNTSSNHMDTNLRVSTGASSLQLSDGTQLSVMPDGSKVLNMQNTISNIGASVDYSSAYRTSFMQSADRAATAARQDQHHYSEASNTAMRNVYEVVSHLNKAEEYAARVGVTGQQELMEYIASQPNRDGTDKLGTSSVPRIMRDPELRDQYINQFMNEHRNELKNRGRMVFHHHSKR